MADVPAGNKGLEKTDKGNFPLGDIVVDSVFPDLNVNPQKARIHAVKQGQFHYLWRNYSELGNFRQGDTIKDAERNLTTDDQGYYMLICPYTIVRDYEL